MKPKIIGVTIAVVPANTPGKSSATVWRAIGWNTYPLTLRNYWRAVGMQLRLAGLVANPFLEQYRRYRETLEQIHKGQPDWWENVDNEGE